MVNCVYIYTYTYTAINSVKIQTPTHWYQDQPQHDCPAACVIAQHYSSATFISLRRHSRKENFVTRFKNVISIMFLSLFKNFVSLKLPNFKLRKSKNVFVQNMQLKKRR
jgi:hypothetical protein